MWRFENDRLPFWTHVSGYCRWGFLPGWFDSCCSGQSPWNADYRAGNGPAGVINLEVEPVIGAGFILAKILYKKNIPVLDRLQPNPFSVINNGDHVLLNGEKGIVEVYKK